MPLKTLLRKPGENDSRYCRYQCVDVRNILVRHPIKNFRCLAKKYPGIDLVPIIELVTIHSELFVPLSLPAPVSRDPDDDKFIALAMAVNCKIIVSGDKDLLDIDRYDGVKIIKPGDFVKQYLS